MKTTTGSMTKRVSNNSYYNEQYDLFMCDCGHCKRKIKEHDAHILGAHRYDPYVIERVVGVELWENWREVLRRN